ncbi:MAG TPA: ferritin [Methanomassiliicoccales archaeon]|nr:ferritin [Methanomassiliicoccales archaeon]
MNDRIEKAFNEQLNAEVYSSYLYLSMNAYFHSINLPGFANWMLVQAQEELQHGMKFYDFIVDQGGRVILTTIEGPQLKWDSPLAAFEHQQAHEKKVTGLINKLVDLAIKVNDHAAHEFLQWFVKEQVEEEANARDLVAKATMVCDDGPGLFILDRDLASRPQKIVLAKKE